MAAQQYEEPRLDDDVEASGESDGLLGGSRQEQGWTHYPAQWWAQSRAAVDDWTRKRKDLGKRRQQEAAQQSSTSDPLHDDSGQQPSRMRQLQREHPKAFTAFVLLSGLISILIVLIVILAIHLFAITLRSPDDATQQRILARSFNIDGPDNVQVISVDDNGLTVQIDGRIGLDPDSALDEWLGARAHMSWWKRKDRDVVEWAVNKVKGVQVDVQSLALRSPDWSVKRSIDRLDLFPDDDDKPQKVSALGKATPPPPPTELVSFHFEPLLVPLPAIGSSKGKDKSKNDAPVANLPVNLTIVVKPSGPALLSFAEYTLENKTAFLDIEVRNAKVRGLNGKDFLRGFVTSSSWWSMAGWLNVRMGETWKRLAQDIPKVGGDDTDPDEFLNLTRYDFQEIGGPNDNYPERALGLDIFAEAMNPLGKLLKGHVGYSLPFGAYLPVLHGNDSASSDKKQPMETVLLAAVATEPFDIHGEKKIPLRLHGRVIPPPTTLVDRRRGQKPLGSDSSNPAADALSNFLSRFLRGDTNTLYVRGGSPFTAPKTQGKEGQLPMPGGGSDDLPVWLDRLLRVASVPISFPGSKVTDLIQNVSISDLKITPHPFETDKLVCSGVIMGVMNMPGQLATVDVEITDLWPDVLIFNGKPPGMGNKTEGVQDDRLSKRSKGHKGKHGDDDGGDDDDAPTPDPLPDPLPEHAFGRVVPHKWAKAETYIDPEDPEGKRKLLRSELKNVPFTVLPGRGGEFRSFSWKIVTGQGALAGIDGKAKAKIWNSGLGKLVLSNMPVQGVFTVGKRGSGGDDGDGDGDDGLRAA